jgi:subtilisin-like proprotein convertase family protein
MRIMKKKFARKQETKLENGLTPRGHYAALRRRSLAVASLALVVLSGTIHCAQADTFSATNGAAITTPDSGPASLYPSQVTYSGFTGMVTKVRVVLHNVTHSFPGDYDILLVAPGGRSTLLMSDCGAGFGLNNVTLTFSDEGASLPDGGQITTGTWRPTNYGGATDTFPPAAAQSYSASLAVFNNISPNGDWKLYVVDDGTQDTGTIAGGWTLELTLSEFDNLTTTTIPDSGPANPYPSQINVTGLTGNIKKVRVVIALSHTFPDDVDILLVGPGGQNAIIMSDVGGSTDVGDAVLTFDDSAATDLPDNGPLVTGTFRPTNYGTGDTFPAPAPAPAGTSPLSVFNGTDPNGTWRLYVVDDNGQDMGQIFGWVLSFDLEASSLANLSTRLRVDTGNNVLIGGLIVTGTQPKNVLLRAIGPSLPVAGALSDPTLELRDGQGGLLWFNDDWQNGAQGFPSQTAQIIATGAAPTNPLESAMVVTLPANNAGYTAIVRGFDNATGIGLVEAYDLDRTVDSRLGNISTRGLVETGNNVLIAGTLVLGSPSQRVIVRAIGPTLPFGAADLQDPTLELRDGNAALIASNDDWRDTQAADIIATGIPPTNDLESAIVATLPSAGAAYTAIVRGFDNTTGVGLVEVYALN